MARYRMIVRINPADARDAEFNRWYDGEHVGHVLAVPGFVASARYRVVDAHGPRRFRYCTVFEIETDDLAATLAELRAQAADGRMTLSPSLDPAVEFEVIEPMEPAPPEDGHEHGPRRAEA
jgi:hypothetical protein